MLEQLFNGELAGNFSIGNTLIIMAASLALGAAVAGIYILTHRREGYGSELPTTLIMLPATVAIIILLIGNNIAGAFTLAGAFSLVRFRAATGNAKDVAYVFVSVAVGLACGLGYIGYGALFAAVLCAAMSVLYLTNFGSAPKGSMLLKITMPENLDFSTAFDDIFDKYAKNIRRIRVRTVDYGSLFEASYNLILQNGASEKEFIDALRCRNGNLNITLTRREHEEKVYPF